ncbi:hypothetical protein ACWEQ4_01370 [Rhodococcus sp. NPDC003994]
MSTAATVAAFAATFAGGTGFPALLTYLSNRKTAETASDSASVVAAKTVNEMALNTLTTYISELEVVKGRLTTVETQLAASRAEQARITNLFQQAIDALRDFIVIAQARDLPTPVMSPELRAELGRSV